MSFSLKLQNTPDGHPLEVGSDGIHLALINADHGPIITERLLGVVEGAETVPVSVVCNLCVHVSSCRPMIPSSSPPWSSHVAIHGKSFDRSCRSGSVRY